MKRDQIGGQDAPARRGASKGSIRDSGENVKKYSLEPTEEAKTNVNSYSREPESITELRRQNERLLAQATNEDAANENERGLIKDYKRQYDKVSGIAEKLNTARQEVLTAENGGLKLKVVNLKTDP